ncbi:helix-turn-helix domain-containing protein [Brachybacterium sacelli]|uniref:DNA-binding NarL/FixJ family response regulator n=1 Tax=Brachybacterium sacelli TaxID=173364 RepID=A0ABS4X601_9MICO|nr:helix-turn-helix domain-containing protein [Brachybacterium sacelli]MBP2383756.1 DNA-binding NarL/FixJ family response regulator [Brachybacterium sacelli]
MMDDRLREMRAAVHKRTADEYVRPTGERRMSSWETARSISIGDRRDFSERPLSWMGVRGTKFHDPALLFHAPGTWHEVWGELVPEPFNPADDHALAVDLDGIRLGYASARYAYYAHPYVAALNGQGDGVFVPLQYRCDYDRYLEALIASAFVALPTFEEFEKLFPDDDSYLELLAPLWDALDDDVRAQIARDRFHLTEETLAAMIELRHLAPTAGIPYLPRVHAIPPGVDHFLHQKRLEADAAAARAREQRNRRTVSLFKEGWRQADIARELGVSSSTIAKTLRNAGVDTSAKREPPEQRVHGEKILRLINDGRTRREITAELGVSAYTVDKVAKEHGVTIRSEAGLNDYTRDRMHERLAVCRRALELQANGLSRAEIAEQLGTSKELTKSYLSDGRFFAEPTSNMERLDIAQAVRANGMTQAQAAGNAERRAIRDANMLDLIGKPWL